MVNAFYDPEQNAIGKLGQKISNKTWKCSNDLFNVSIISVIPAGILGFPLCGNGVQ